MQLTAIDHPRTMKPTTILALVVEPDTGARELYAGVLRPFAFEVEYADDGRDALAKAIGRKPGVVVTDTRLGFINGYILCSLLRADPITADAAIVVVTVDASPADVERALTSGADRVLAKPCAPQALSGAIAQARDRHRRAAARSVRTPTRSGTDGQTGDDSAKPATERGRRFLSSAHRRFETSTPATDPPCLSCPACHQRLRYVRSQIGGVSARCSEQWDYYVCANTCGTFQYRHRTRHLRRIA